MNEEKLLEYMKKESLDGFLVRKKVNVRYLSGYTGDDSSLFVTRGALYFLTDPRYTEQAALECPDYRLVNVRAKPGTPLGTIVAELAAKENVRRLGFEDEMMNFRDYEGFRAAFQGELVPTSQIIEQMRIIKSPAEIACLRAACDISCRAFERILKEIRIGVTEKELAAKLSLFMVQEGSDTMPYGNILISGARTSLLHGIPSEKAVEYGDFVLMDFGCQYHGYLSDMTRTVIVGRPTPKQREVYELTQRMIQDSLDVTKAGTPCPEIYKASLHAVAGTEYEPYTYGNIGHGIGLFVHELPYSSAVSPDILMAGNVRTIEPGIYIPGWGGVRIEDQILVTEDGYDNMISTTHELIVL
ncbi:MAG: Xaa-Pro peptidase family protein [Lachnospiraceae bacterium]|jgi:Xaa-Pro aminopeptidase|nr:Xaa-Pro peptidase family protein [Lachnospiraceae bacterium]MCI1726141.1 Xaa-Pro peptidase family protein [Lachnospiraceae bacterium]